VDANVNTLQTVNSTALTRYTTGAGVFLTVEVSTALGATPANLTITYTNQAGTGSRSTTFAMTPSAIVARLQPASNGPSAFLQSGDYGVRSIQSAQFSAAMGSGAVALQLFKPLAMVPGIAGNAYVERDSTTQIDGISLLPVGTDNELGSLIVYALPNGTSSGTATFFFRSCEG
jgi:hypothetical protein